MAIVNGYDFLEGQMAADANADFPDQRRRKQFMSTVMGGGNGDQPASWDPDEPDAEPDWDEDDPFRNERSQWSGEKYSDINVPTLYSYKDPDVSARSVLPPTRNAPAGQESALRAIDRAAAEARAAEEMKYTQNRREQATPLLPSKPIHATPTPVPTAAPAGVAGVLAQATPTSPMAAAETPEQRGTRIAGERFTRSPAAGRLDLASAIAAAQRKAQTGESMSDIEAEMAAANVERSKLFLQDQIARSRYDPRASDWLWNYSGQNPQNYKAMQTTGKDLMQLGMEAQQQRRADQMTMVNLQAQQQNIVNQNEAAKIAIQQQVANNQLTVEQGRIAQAQAEADAKRKLSELQFEQQKRLNEIAAAKQTSEDAEWKARDVREREAEANRRALGEKEIAEKYKPRPYGMDKAYADAYDAAIKEGNTREQAQAIADAKIAGMRGVGTTQGGATPPPDAALPRVTKPEDMNKVKVGEWFIAPNGTKQRRTK